MHLCKRVRLLAWSLWYSRWSQLSFRVKLMVGRRLGWLKLDWVGKPRQLGRRKQPEKSSLSQGAWRHTCEGPQGSVLAQDRVQYPLVWEVPAVGVGRPLAALEIHYLRFLHGIQDEDFLFVSENWIQNNGTPHGRWWQTSWNSYGLAIRCMVWMQELARRWERLDPSRRESLVQEVARQISFLERNLEKDLGGNHLLKNYCALLLAGRFFTGQQPRRWAALGERGLLGELDEQVLSDGLHYERSWMYHCDILADLLCCYEALGDQDMFGPETRHRLGRKLDAMAQTLVDGTQPDGRIALCNDAGMHKAILPAEVLARYATLRGPTPAARAVFALPEAGYFGFRRGGEYFVADCGPIAPDHLPAHGHGDILAFEWTLDGKRMIVDFGVLEYTAGEWRARCRATQSHNTVTVDDEDQCEFWSSFRVARRARILNREFQRDSHGFVLEGSHSGYQHLRGKPVHLRRFVAHPGRIEITDEVRGGNGQAVRARFLLHPECAVTVGERSATIVRGEVRIELTSSAEVSVRDYWWCPDFGVLHPTKQIVVDYGPAPCSGKVLLERPQRG